MLIRKLEFKLSFPSNPSFPIHYAEGKSMKILEAGSRGKAHSSSAWMTGRTFVPDPYRAQGTWVSPCHWAALASPKMPQMKSQSGRQEERQRGSNQKEVSGKQGGLQPTKGSDKEWKHQSRMRPHHRRPLQEKLCPGLPRPVVHPEIQVGVGGDPHHKQVLGPHVHRQCGIRLPDQEITLI